jgi:hypothetical protein
MILIIFRFRLVKSKFQNYKNRGFTSGIRNGYRFDLVSATIAVI